MVMGPDRMQSRVAVLGDVDLRTPEKMAAFLAREPVRDVPRVGGRGLILHTAAARHGHDARFREGQDTWPANAFPFRRHPTPMHAAFCVHECLGTRKAGSGRR